MERKTIVGILCVLFCFGLIWIGLKRTANAQDNEDKQQAEVVVEKSPDEIAQENYEKAKKVADAIKDGKDMTKELKNLTFPEGSDFKGLNFSGVNFSGSKLAGAIFSDATLSGVNFDGSDLDGAQFDGAKLTGAHFYNKANLKSANFNYAYGNFKLETTGDGQTLVRGADFSNVKENSELLTPIKIKWLKKNGATPPSPEEEASEEEEE